MCAHDELIAAPSRATRRTSGEPMANLTSYSNALDAKDDAAASSSKRRRAIATSSTTSPNRSSFASQLALRRDELSIRLRVHPLDARRRWRSPRRHAPDGRAGARRLPGRRPLIGMIEAKQTNKGKTGGIIGVPFRSTPTLTNVSPRSPSCRSHCSPKSRASSNRTTAAWEEVQGDGTERSEARARHRRGRRQRLRDGSCRLALRARYSTDAKICREADGHCEK
jgi:hypothetical protein